MIPILAVLIGLLLILLIIRFIERLAIVLLIGGLIVFAILVVLFLSASAGALS